MASSEAAIDKASQESKQARWDWLENSLKEHIVHYSTVYPHAITLPWDYQERNRELSEVVSKDLSALTQRRMQ